MTHRESRLIMTKEQKRKQQVDQNFQTIHNQMRWDITTQSLIFTVWKLKASLQTPSYPGRVWAPPPTWGRSVCGLEFLLPLQARFEVLCFAKGQHEVVTLVEGNQKSSRLLHLSRSSLSPTTQEMLFSLLGPHLSYLPAVHSAPRQ